MRRALSIVLAVGLVAGVATIVVKQLMGPPLVTARGVVGSEKVSFFNDAQVKQAFARHGLHAS